VTIQVVTRIEELRSLLDDDRAARRSIGFVPTMGYLHEGHLSLMRAARQDTDRVVASLFVNPLQFAANEDLSSYPRDFERDLELARSVGVDVMFAPDGDEMYPDGQVLTSVCVSGLSEGWEGTSRPTHFAGVATVVTKLFAIVGACRAYFGEKDFQQLRVVTQLAADLSLPVQVIGCPIVREPDGLAMSSRNVYLSPDQRRAALVLSRALDGGVAALEAGATDVETVEQAMAAPLDAEPLARRDYVGVVDPATLRVPSSLHGSLRLLVAAGFGRTRLLDNRAYPAPVRFSPVEQGGQA
jgi:pantoate--beta-alanine ligase